MTHRAYNLAKARYWLAQAVVTRQQDDDPSYHALCLTIAGKFRRLAMHDESCRYCY